MRADGAGSAALAGRGSGKTSGCRPPNTVASGTTTVAMAITGPRIQGNSWASTGPLLWGTSPDSGLCSSRVLPFASRAATGFVEVDDLVAEAEIKD